MEYLALALVFAFGAIVGSFLNVVVLRFDTGASIARGRSKCFSCGKTLSWHELVPVLSYLAQRGRCRGCGSKISPQYPLVEALGGFAFIVAYLWAYPGEGALPVLSFIFFAALLSIYIAIAAYDLRHKIIPDEFSYAAAAVALGLVAIRWAMGGTLGWTELASGPILFAFYGSFWLFSKGRWMGLGDAKLALSVGWALGLWSGIAATLLSFWIGSVAMLCAIAVQKIRAKGSLGFKTEIPFGPFILLGFLASLLFGIDIQTVLSFLAV